MARKNKNIALAAEIAAGRVEVHLAEVRVPVKLSDVTSGKVKAFQPGAWRSPDWRQSSQYNQDLLEARTGYICDDPIEQAFAEGALRIAGFRIPDFDLWLDALEPSDARYELAIRRHGAFDALCANDESGVLRHCEWMANRRREIQDKGILLPKAQRADKLQAGQHRKRGSRMPKLDAWLRKRLANTNLRTNAELFQALPDGESDSDLYRDGDYCDDGKVVEIDRKGREHSIQRGAFDKRVAKARRRPDASN